MGLNHGWRGPNIVRDGLVLYLDAGSPNSYQGSGTTWKDISKVNQNNGTLVNGPTFDSGNGGSIVFDGVDDRSTGQIGGITNLFSVEIWLKPNLVQPKRTWAAVIGHTNVGNLHFLISTNNVATFGTWNGLGVSGKQFNFDLQDQETISTVFTLENGLAKCYINGVYFDQGNTPMNLTANTFYLGQAFYGESYYKGGISNFKIYNRALSAQEVLQNYNATKGRFGL